MSLSSLRFRCLLSVLGAAALAACVVVPAASAQTTTFTGKVYSPQGPTNGDPIPNILVFVQDTSNANGSGSGSGTLPTFSKGVTIPTGTQTGCTAQPSLTPSSVLGYASTDATGSFTFNVTGALPPIVNVVIQAGKWRRQYPYPLAMIQGFMSNGQVALPAMTMPPASGTSTDNGVTTIADLPHIAVVTGSADHIECIFPQIGIQGSEITDPTGTGSINFFYTLRGTAQNGAKISANTPNSSALLSSTAQYPATNYDIVIFGCQGSTGDPNASPDAPNLVPYTNDGGRVFATHWEYEWLADAQAWSSIADWGTPTAGKSLSTATGQLDPNYSGYATLDAWMKNVNAFDVSVANNEFSLPSSFENTTKVNAPGEIWATYPNNSGYAAQLSFDTPLGTAGTPTAATAFTNVTNTGTAFLTGDPSDKVVINVTNTSTTATQPGLTLTLQIPSVLQVQSVADSSGGSWSCTFSSPTAICTLPGALAAGASDAVTVSFSIPLGTTLGTYTLSSVLTNGGLGNATQCGRVLYNDYHVETVGSSTTFSTSACSVSKLTAAQKFLEYSLYNLSNFVAPANSDNIQIQASSTITWNPPYPAYYGIMIAQIEDATVNTAGMTTYSFTPTGTDLLNANTYTFKASFAPTDSTDYLPSSATQTVAILPDPTTAAINGVTTPLYYGQQIGQGATLVIATQAGLPNLTTTPSVTGGTFTLSLDGATVCSGAGATATVGGAGCLATPALVGIAGTHTLSLTYSGTTDFAAPTPYTTSVVINSDPTTTTLTTTGTGNSTYGSLLTYTAQIADTYAAPVGTVTFYDSPTAVPAGSTPATGLTTLYSTPVVNYSASFSLTTLAAGTHNILACFAAPLDSQGFPNMLPSCSASTAQTIAPIPPNVHPTQTLVTSNVNPSAFGQAVTFTANVATTDAFITIPTGAVTFYDGTSVLGTGTLDSNGNASYTTSTLAIGTHPITVAYAGATAFSASTSPVYNQVVVYALPSAGTGFVLQVVPTNVTVPVGSSVAVAVTIIELNNFQQPVQLSCSGMPAEGVCTFAQSLIPAAGGTTQLAIGATAPHDCGSNVPYFVAGGRGAGLVWLGVTGLVLFLARKRRRLLQSLALAAALLLIPALQGCGTGNCTDFGLKPGSYTFTVTAVSTGSPSVTKTQAMTMTVTITQ